jgi:hypothetical protein
MLNTSGLAWSRGRYVLRPMGSVFNDEKKLSIEANLSHDAAWGVRDLNELARRRTRRGEAR